jgi:hypothetical protein
MVITAAKGTTASNPLPHLRANSTNGLDLRRAAPDG